MTDPKLSPTEDLILTLLVSRRRLGERMFRIDTRNGAAMRRMRDLGLVEVHNRDIPNAVQVSLTMRGLVLGLDPELTAIMEPETCQSFYIGPRSSEHQFYCDKKNGHRGKKHRYTAYGHLEKPLRWTDEEAGGLASKRYGADLRRYAKTRERLLAEAIVEVRPTAEMSDYARFL